MLLVLMRHGSAQRGGPFADADRPLLAVGRSESEGAGLVLGRLGVRPAALLTSPARRCRQTAELVGKALHLPETSIHVDDGLAVGAGAERILAALAQQMALVAPAAAASASWLVVGHQPDLESVAQKLLGAASLELFLPPGGCIVLEGRDGTLRPPVALRWLLPPALLSLGDTPP